MDLDGVSDLGNSVNYEDVGFAHSVCMNSCSHRTQLWRNTRRFYLFQREYSSFMILTAHISYYGDTVSKTFYRIFKL